MKTILSAVVAIVFALSITACQTPKKECSMSKSAKCDMKTKKCPKR